MDKTPLAACLAQIYLGVLSENDACCTLVLGSGKHVKSVQAVCLSAVATTCKHMLISSGLEADLFPFKGPMLKGSHKRHFKFKNA